MVNYNKLQAELEEALEGVLANNICMFSRVENLFDAVDSTNKKVLKEFMLVKTKGNNQKAAQGLGVNRNTLRKWSK